MLKSELIHPQISQIIAQAGHRSNRPIRQSVVQTSVRAMRCARSMIKITRVHIVPSRASISSRASRDGRATARGTRQSPTTLTSDARARRRRASARDGASRDERVDRNARERTLASGRDAHGREVRYGREHLADVGREMADA